MTELSDVLTRIWTDLVDRASGPYSFRFYLQPIMATIMATVDGIKDAKTGRSPYFWTVLHVPEKRGPRLREGLKSTLRIILLGIVMDTLYQYKVLKTFYPVEMLDIIIVLAFLPYLLMRGPISRLARWWMKRRAEIATH